MPLRTRQLIPPLTIRTTEGHLVQAWDFKQKKSLVITFLDANCAQCEEFLDQLKARASDFGVHNAIILVAYLEPPRPGTTESLPKNVIAGVDVSGRSARAFLGEDAVCASSRGARGVFVTDRYGELAAIWLVSQHEFPGTEAIRSALRGIEIACECYTPDCPSDD